jgi:hypothetical protein
VASDPQSTFITDSVGQPEPVTVVTPCNRVTIFENGNASQDYRVRLKSATNTPITHTMGSATIFISRGGLFKPGEIVGYTETITGSITMAQIEELILQ